MPRKIDEKETRKALRKLRRAQERASREDSAGLTEWEAGFVESLEERLKTYGSGFNDPEKGNPREALSARQKQAVNRIGKKTKAKPSADGGAAAPPRRNKGLSTRKPRPAANVRDINEDVPEAPDDTRSPQPVGRPNLKVIRGGLAE